MEDVSFTQGFYKSTQGNSFFDKASKTEISSIFYTKSCVGFAYLI